MKAGPTSCLTATVCTMGVYYGFPKAATTKLLQSESYIGMEKRSESPGSYGPALASPLASVSRRYLLDYGLLAAILSDEERLVLRTELGQQRSALMSERETAVQRVEAAKHAGRALSQRLLWFFRSRARRWCRSIPSRT